MMIIFWGISLVGTDEEESSSTSINNNSITPTGTELSYTINKPNMNIPKEDQVKVDENIDLSDLMSQLKQISGK